MSVVPLAVTNFTVETHKPAAEMIRDLNEADVNEVILLHSDYYTLEGDHHHVYKFRIPQRACLDRDEFR